MNQLKANWTLRANGKQLPPGKNVTRDDLEKKFKLEESEIDGLIKGGCLSPVRQEVEPESDGDENSVSDRIEFVVSAIQALDEENESLWTKNGQPNLNALREAADDDSITDAERDAAWAIIQKAESE